MKIAWLVVVMACTVLATSPAWAEHNGPAPSRDAVDVNIDLKFFNDGFRLGGTIAGLEGVYGAWFNGKIRPDGLSVDGRVQHPDRTYNFKINADVADWLRRSLGGFGDGI